MKADLHCHSTYSDGTVSPEGIVDLAYTRGLDAVVVTDHDTTASYDELQAAAKAKGLKSLTGIEISTVYHDISVHLLGYAFDSRARTISEYETRFLAARKRRAEAMVAKLTSLGLSISIEDLAPFEKERNAVGRPHIAQILVSKGEASSLQEVFFRYLGEGKVAYIPQERPSVSQALQVIHDAGGVAVLAHPQLYRNKQIVKKLTQEFPIDGVEAHYCRFRGNEVSYWCRLAQERQLLVTGGSDFHGANREGVEYGNSTAPEETVELLLNKMASYGG